MTKLDSQLWVPYNLLFEIQYTSHEKHPGDTYYDILKHLNFIYNNKVKNSKVSFLRYLDTTKIQRIQKTMKLLKRICCVFWLDF